MSKLDRLANGTEGVDYAVVLSGSGPEVREEWERRRLVASAAQILQELGPEPRPTVELRRVGGSGPIDLTAGAPKATPKPVTASSAKPTGEFTPFLNVAPEAPRSLPVE